MSGSVVGHIVRSRYLQAPLLHYRRMVQQLEDSEQLLQWLQQVVLARHAYPFRPSSHHQVTVAECDRDGFHLGCLEVALHYEWIQPPPQRSALSYNIDHVSRRNRHLYHLLQLLQQRQWRWIESGEASDLQRYPYREVVGDYRQRWGGYIDLSMVSRLVTVNRIIRIGGDQEMPYYALRELFPRRWEMIGERIRLLLQDREKIWTDAALAAELTQLQQPLSRRYVTHIRNRYGLPPGRGRRLKQRPSTPPICWGVLGPSMQSSWGGYRSVPGSMSYRAHPG